MGHSKQIVVAGLQTGDFRVPHNKMFTTASGLDRRVPRPRFPEGGVFDLDFNRQQFQRLTIPFEC